MSGPRQPPQNDLEELLEQTGRWGLRVGLAAILLGSAVLSGSLIWLLLAGARSWVCR